MQISVEIHDHKGVASSLVNIGTVYNYENNFDTALNYYQNALAIVEKIGDREEEAFLYCNIGNVYKNKGLIDKALMHFQKSLLIAKEINNKPTVAKVLGNIGNIYQVRNDNRALNYHLEALAVFNAIGDRQGGACELSNIGGFYFLKGNIDDALRSSTKQKEIQLRLLNITSGLLHFLMSLIW